MVVLFLSSVWVIYVDALFDMANAIQQTSNHTPEFLLSV